MVQERAGVERNEIAGNDNRARKAPPPHSAPSPEVRKPGFGERWRELQFSKAAIFWILLAGIVLTMFIGFNWGGWVTEGTAQKTASSMAQSAVISRLAPICVAQFNLDTQKDVKMGELQGTTSYQRSNYVKDQGWATMPGEGKPDSKVADACSRLIMGE